MRIIAGEAKGRRLVAPDGTETRPTADKTRESLFSILMRLVPGAKVLDLFGGTGALALEAMSRGAESAVICDVSPRAARSIETNIETVMKGASGATLLKADYKKALELLTDRRFDIVFLDPPYRLTEAYAYAAGFLQTHDMLEKDGILVAERSGDVRLVWPEGYEVYDVRTYRDTVLEFVRRRQDE